MRFKGLSVLLGLLLLTAFFSGCAGNTAKNQYTTQPADKALTIVTSFYPMYVHTINVAKDIPNVKVINMTQPQTGCLHDYTFTTNDMRTIESAQVFVINGAGMEQFMDKVIKQTPNLKIVDASKNIELIKDEKTGEENAHLWVSISDAIKQVQNIGEQLAAFDPQNAIRYKNNTDTYVKKLDAERAKMHLALDNVKNRNIITFHEAFPYFAQEFNLNIAAVIEREPGSEPSPKELEDTIKIVKDSKVKALFVEPQYSEKAAETISKETGAKLYTLDPAVTGEANGDYDAYIKVMDNNLKVLVEALK